MLVSICVTANSLGSFDAVSRVVLQRPHLTGLMSTDRAFGDIEGLTTSTRLDPTSSQPTPDWGRAHRVRVQGLHRGSDPC